MASQKDSKLNQQIRLQWIIIALLLIISMSAIFFAFGQQSSINSKSKSPDTPIKGVEQINALEVVRGGETDGKIPDHIRGAQRSRVVAFEYGDLSANHVCSSYESINKKLYNEFSNSVTFVYRNFSLAYPYSLKLMKANEAAYLSNGESAYWSMFDKIATDCSLWSSVNTKMDDASADNRLLSYASDIGLDIQKWRQAIENSDNNGIEDKIERDKQWGLNLNVVGVPTWLVNGQTIDDLSYNSLSAKLTEMIK